MLILVMAMPSQRASAALVIAALVVGLLGAAGAASASASGCCAPGCDDSRDGQRCQGTLAAACCDEPLSIPGPNTLPTPVTMSAHAALLRQTCSVHSALATASVSPQRVSYATVVLRL